MRTRHSDQGSSTSSGSPTEDAIDTAITSPTHTKEQRESTRSHSDQSSDQPPQSGNIRASRSGRLFIISGLSEHHFPTQAPRSSQVSQSGAYPHSRHHIQRGVRKRKHSALLDGETSFRQVSPDDEVPLASQESLDNQLGEVLQSGNDSQGPSPTKRRRRGRHALAVESILPSRAPSPELPILDPELDQLAEVDLPPIFLSEPRTPDPEMPDDDAQRIYEQLYKPLGKAVSFTEALTKYNPRQRSTDNLYALAQNTAAALRAWQDEYLSLEKLTAPHAPIPRRPATGDRQPRSPTTFEDLKEADLYDYIYDPKRPGRQDAIGQRIIRDPSGRELRQRHQRGRVGADGLLISNATAGYLASEDDGGRKRTRKPVNKYDGVVQEQHRRRRGLAALYETSDRDQPAKRGRSAGRGGGRGRGHGRGRGGTGLLGKRIREMRGESGAPSGFSQEDNERSSADALHGIEIIRDVSASVQVCLLCFTQLKRAHD